MTAAVLKATKKAAADYILDRSELPVDKKIVAHVKKFLRQSVAVDDEPYLDKIRAGVPRNMAAREVGLDPLAVYQRMKIDKPFAEKIKLAEAEALEPIVEQARRVALDPSSPNHWKATQFLLERVNPEQFSMPDKKTQIEVKHTVDADNPIIARLLSIQETLAERKKLKELGTGLVLDIPEEDIQEI